MRLRSAFAAAKQTMSALSISTKYKIAKKDLATMAETIKRVGFDKALKWAMDGSCALLDKEPNAPLATTYLSWSINLLNDSRAAKSEADGEKYLQLCTLYRLLAHKIYSKQRKEGSLENIKDFIQLVPSHKREPEKS